MAQFFQMKCKTLNRCLLLKSTKINLGLKQKNIWAARIITMQFAKIASHYSLVLQRENETIMMWKDQCALAAFSQRVDID